jgi:prepilin-type N-terminal cleavage/methylation domain-containing protein
MTAKNRMLRSFDDPRRPRAFTLTELLIVIALIVLLITLLLTALSTVQKKARATTTLSTMQSFSNACDSFQQEHGFYPALVPLRILLHDAAQNNDIPMLSTAENAILHLMGGGVRAEDFTNEEWNNRFPAANGWVVLELEDPDNAAPYEIKVNPGQIGQGPIINGTPYAPYYAPSERELGFADGQVLRSEVEAEDLVLPDLLDAWGQPIIFVSQLRPSGDQIALNIFALGSQTAQFYLAGMNSYTDSESLGRLSQNQIYDSGTNAKGSLLTSQSGQITATIRQNNFARLVGHPALSTTTGGVIRGETRGAYVLISAGADGIYLSAEDGPGTRGNPISNLINESPKVIEDYDDVVLYGG